MLPADPYAWLERLDDPAAAAFVAAQEAATRAVLDAVPGRAALAALVECATRFARRGPPLRTTSGRTFELRGAADDEALVLYVQHAPDAPWHVLVDPATWPAGTALVFAVPSPDGALVAVGISVGSTHAARIRLVDAASGRALPDEVRGHGQGSVAWHPDARGFFYTACPDDDARWHAVYEHRVGGAGRRVFGSTTAPDHWCTVQVSECGRFAVLTTWDFVHANTVHLLRLADATLVPVAPVMQAVHQVQVLDDEVLIVTDLDAPRGRACVASLAAPTAWRTLIAEGADILQTVSGVAGHLYAVYSQAASHRVRIHARTGEYLREVALPALGTVNRNEGEGITSGVRGAWRGSDVWVSFQSYVQPPALYRYDFAADRLVPHHVPDAGPPTVTEQVYCISRDGTRVSMFLVRRADVPRTGPHPVRLTAYGGFNVAFEPWYAPVHAAWLALGGVLAFVNVRGGGEYGRTWHESARTTRRQNAFDDFIAAARWLVDAGVTTPAQLVARGNSNGGLLVAVAAMQAPDAFGAVFCRAALLDLLRFPRFRALGGAVAEYGDPADPVEGAYLAGYSPYENVRPDRRYPPMLFATALNDHVAPPQDPVKMVARLQAEAGEGGPFRLLPLRASGHGGGTTVAARIAQDVDELAFYADVLGLTPPPRA